MAFLAQKLISASGATEATDDDFNLVTGLYHFDGSNGAQNNTYVDSSSTSKTLTESGNVAQGTFSPFSADEGKWSSQFTRASLHNYISPDSSSDFAFGTGDFTIECFCYLTSGGEASGNGLFAPTTGVVGPALGQWNTNGWQIYCGTSETNISNTSYPQNEWVHVAFVRASNVVNVYQNGVKVTSDISDSTNYTNTGFNIGWYYGTAYAWDGYISNFRVVKGTAVYTSAFTPPTEPLTAITNTVLLTLRSNRHVDISTSAHNMTTSNTPKIKPFSPFAPSASYNAAVNGGSSHFPTGETGNKIECGTSADFAFGTGAFTIEAWVYVTADTYPYSRIMNIGPYWNNVNSIGLLADDTDHSSKIALGVYGAVTNARVCVSTNATPRNEWFHVAVTRDGTGDFRLFVNGNLDSTNTSYRTVNVSAGGNQPLTIGGTTDRAVEEPFEGFISNFRVVKGTAVYTSSFTVPTAPVADVTNTKLLANFTNASIFDQTGKTNIDTVGNAQLDTSVKKFGTASAEFDGTGDRLVISNYDMAPIGTQSFTVECFVYVTDVSNYRCIYSAGFGIQIYIWTDSKVQLYIGNAAGGYDVSGFQSTSTISTNTWTHIAVVRDSSNSTLTIFINGTASGQTSVTTDIPKLTGASDYSYVIGAYSNGSYSFSGYIDEMRITNKARYTSNFTAPTEEFANR